MHAAAASNLEMRANGSEQADPALMADDEAVGVSL